LKILVSNDDGYLAPGVQALAQALSQFADVRVIAPDRNRSGASNSLTLDRPLSVRRSSSGFYHVDGTPTDCVHLALTGALDFQPDLVCSGINHGANLGDDTLYSGTVAAAMEGMQFGLPAIAFSMLDPESAHLTELAGICADVVKKLAPRLLGQGPALFNVNIPAIHPQSLLSWQVTRLGKRHSAQAAMVLNNPRGGKLYWIGAAGDSRDGGLGTDFYAVEQGHLSLTPMAIDLTAHDLRGTVQDWLSA
jgi:5'-nucleotidase